MSSLPLTDPHNIIDDSDQFLNPLDLLDDSYWSLYQEILQSAAPPDEIINEENSCNNHNSEDTANSSAVHVEQQQSAAPQAAEIVENGLELMKISTPQSKTRKKNSRINNDENGAMEQSAEEGPSVAKKLDHNAKERIRRMKLNASYLALRALLPDSRRSKVITEHHNY